MTDTLRWYSPLKTGYCEDHGFCKKGTDKWIHSFFFK